MEERGALENILYNLKIVYCAKENSLLVKGRNKSPCG
jgi:hypothetical protein